MILFHPISSARSTPVNKVKGHSTGFKHEGQFICHWGHLAVYVNHGSGGIKS